MTKSIENRIAKNIIFLYIRQIITLIIGLYTSRIILETLGIENYGIYNVVGGIVAMLNFLNTAMSITTQRYLTFELGRGNINKLQKVFTASVLIHFLIALIILILGESIGLWFLYNKLTIPTDKIASAAWAYQFSILAAILMIISVPYNACIIAHEKMKAFSYITIIETFLKLLIAYTLYFIPFDKLKTYALLIFLVHLTIRIIFGYYCKKNFKESQFTLPIDKPLLKEMSKFTGWNLVNDISTITYTQGINILLNTFFTPTINAARGIAIQLQNAVYNFCNNFQTAINPQITKTYATNDISTMHNLIYASSKYSFFLLLIVLSPLLFDTNYILQIWLKNVPDYTVSFVRIILCITVIDCISNPLLTSAKATGNIKKLQCISGTIYFSILPISYICLSLGLPPQSVFVTHFSIAIIIWIIRLVLIKRMINLSFKRYISDVILRILPIIIISSILSYFIYKYMPHSNIFYLFFDYGMYLIILLSFIFLIGLNNHEKIFIKKAIISSQILKKIKK